ncbi:MAG: sodium:proton antiporter [Firmicutes bacterium HGW-Firmicutes-12]|jgi:NhaA family Na+:H+ antiporter|nr:MAG: sodium:proton antiporter [Firmicutes bacterium HGW-Firmicutes-12]
MRKKIQLLQQFSVPLIAGVIVALFWANISPDSYHHLIEKDLFFGFNFHHLVNEIFMVFFFAIAAVEITQSIQPGGALSPIKTAINPLFATVGGVLGPVAIYLGLNVLFGSAELTRGWGIPTATDIALAWLVARFVFGSAHPAVKFLLLLAIVDDAIGLLIIAIFYPDPLHPTVPAWLLLILVGMGLSYLFRRMQLKSYWPYLLIGGALSWIGLFKAHLHPALALVFIIPFLPHPKKEEASIFEHDTHDHSTLSKFEHEWKVFVDFGLFFFGLANAGVEFSGMGTATWLVLAGLLVGKIVGIYGLGFIAEKVGFPFPEGMDKRDLFVVGIIAALGLTVALFVAGAAFTDPEIQGAAKMGALFSVIAAALALIAGKFLLIKKRF